LRTGINCAVKGLIMLTPQRRASQAMYGSRTDLEPTHLAIGLSSGCRTHTSLISWDTRYGAGISPCQAATPQRPISNCRFGHLPVQPAGLGPVVQQRAAQQARRQIRGTAGHHQLRRAYRLQGRPHAVASTCRNSCSVDIWRDKLAGLEWM
jgi:hypothetical protein